MDIPALDVPRIQVSDRDVSSSISRSLTPLCSSFLLLVFGFHLNSSFQITLPFAFSHLTTSASSTCPQSSSSCSASRSLTASHSHRSGIILFYRAAFFISPLSRFSSFPDEESLTEHGRMTS